MSMVPQASLRLKIYFCRDEMYNVREALSCSMNLFPTENYSTAGTKRVISSMQSFTKKISRRKGKDSGEIVLYPVNIVEHCS